MRMRIDSRGDFNKTLGWLSKTILKSPVSTLRQVARDGEKVLSDKTPKDTGETASGWVSEVYSGFGKSEVSWGNIAHPQTAVSVARIIDQGHGTGTGGYVPPRPYIREAMDSVWEKASDDVVKGLIK